jgi:hypothetical protein
MPTHTDTEANPIELMFDPGLWTNLASVATVLSAATLISGAWVWWRGRRAIKPVKFGWDLLGVETVSRFPRRAGHLFEIRNSGSGRAYILALQVVEGAIIQSPAHRARKTLGSGESFTLLISAKDIRRTWFRVMWREESDDATAFVKWGFVAPSERDESGAKVPRPVPEGAKEETITDLEATYAERERWLRLQGQMNSSAFPGATNTPDLPFIENLHSASLWLCGENRRY